MTIELNCMRSIQNGSLYMVTEWVEPAIWRRNSPQPEFGVPVQFGAADWLHWWPPGADKPSPAMAINKLQN